MGARRTTGEEDEGPRCASTPERAKRLRRCGQPLCAPAAIGSARACAFLAEWRMLYAVCGHCDCT
eukprot:7348039-Pyramimonas_sp.AAC.1